MLVAWQIRPSPHTAKLPVCENHVAWDLHPCCRSPSSACTNCRKIQAKPDGNSCPHAKWWHMGSTHHCHGTFLLWSQSTSLSWYDQLQSIHEVSRQHWLHLQQSGRSGPALQSWDSGCHSHWQHLPIHLPGCQRWRWDHRWHQHPQRNARSACC